ncbi:MAG: hypothetical protein CVU77_00780 [Elusimicrobia bacterium HGW-Elusimicrobia-1]|jgi:radical SAM superfamily enzyme YgiQ (UPF0313 family)|nr:MAG: hypothetical protein CVU77_00780 [Elusimicrobia bacterium HGW-Elusimicrobia-1]
MAKYKVALAQISNSFSGQNYLPYSAGILAAYAKKYISDAAKYEFSIPLYKRMPVAPAVDSFRTADLVFFSAYTWNINLSLAIAEKLKSVRKQTLIVFGGPEVPERGAAEFLKKNPFIDLLVFGEGERPFLKILETYPVMDFADVPSTGYYSGGRYTAMPKCPRIGDLGEIPSPYISGAFDDLMRANPSENWVALWETNRGCPFSCSYCVWGAYDQNKVYFRDIRELKEEMDWFSKNKIEFIFCCDANFGIAARDMDIVRMAAENKEKYGYPRAFSVQNTKNSTTRIFDIYRAMSGAGLNKGVSLALQSVNPATLESVRRKNISTETFYELQTIFNRAGIESFTDVILPLPLETYDTFSSGVAAIIANGQHGRIQFNNLSVLTNSEMDDPEYQKKYGIETVGVKLVNIHGSIVDDEIAETQKLVIATSSMPPRDWARARVFAWMTAFLYFNKTLQVPMAVLNNVYGTGHRETIEKFLAVGGEYPIIYALKEKFFLKAEAIQKGESEFCESTEWLNIWWPADELAFVELCAGGNLEGFYAEAEALLGDLMKSRGDAGFETILAESVLLNKNLIKMPFNKTGLDLKLSYNVREIYASALAGGKTSPRKGDFRCRVDRTSAGWTSWEDWCREVVWYGNKRGAYLYSCKDID